MKNAVVTGVSTGIGAGIMAQLIAAGWRVFGSVRRKEDAAAAKARHGSQFEPLLFDTTDEEAVIAAADLVRRELGGAVLDGLVNNAGFAVSGPLIAQPTDDFRRQIDVNLIGPFIVTKAFAPLLGAREGAPPGRGRVVNISSIGGRICPPFLGGYAASKHGLEGMSGTLRRELQIYGIDVVVIGPGSVATPIWDKTEGEVHSYLTDTIWEKPLETFIQLMVKDGRKGFPPEKIGDVVLEALTAARPKTRYAPVPGKFANWILPTRLPPRIVDRLIGKQLGLLPER